MDTKALTTTEARMKAILELRERILSGQKVHQTLQEELAGPMAELALKKASLDNAFEDVHGETVERMTAVQTKIEEAEKDIRQLIVEEYESRGVVERKDKQVAPNLGVQVRETRTIEGEHEDILKDVTEKYPTLLTYDPKKLVKQSEIYDVVEQDIVACDDGEQMGVQYFIKEMPYIRISRNATAVIKKGFWDAQD